MNNELVTNYLKPLGVYIAVLAVIVILRLFIPGEFSFSLAAILMFSVPFLLRSEMRCLRWDARGFLIGLAVTLVILIIYLSIVLALTENKINISELTISLILVQLFLVSVPEEVFFRGYLQEKIGNNLKGILFVSLLFALGHFCTLCILSGFIGDVCAQSILTFFPSIIMGYLYARTGTLWGSIIFHFFSNIAFISTGALNIFYDFYHLIHHML